jgi:hypothetical protein
MKKRIIIQNAANRDSVFEVERIRDRYHLTQLHFTTFFTNRHRIGEVGNLEDVISLAKASVDGEIRHIKIKDI